MPTETLAAPQLRSPAQASQERQAAKATALQAKQAAADRDRLSEQQNEIEDDLRTHTTIAHGVQGQLREAMERMSNVPNRPPVDRAYLYTFGLLAIIVLDLLLFRELAELLSGKFEEGAPWFAGAVPYVTPLIIVTVEMLIGHEAAKAWTNWRRPQESMEEEDVRDAKRMRDGLTTLAVAISLAVPLATLGAFLAGGGGLLDPKLYVVLILNLACHGLVVARGSVFLDAIEQLWPWSGETAARRRVESLREEYAQVREDTARDVARWLTNGNQLLAAGGPLTTTLDVTSRAWANFVAGEPVMALPGPDAERIPNPFFDTEDGATGSRVSNPFDPPSGGVAATNTLVLPAPEQTERAHPEDPTVRYDEQEKGPLPSPTPDGDLNGYLRALVQAQVTKNDSAVTR